MVSFLKVPRAPISTLFPYTTLFRSSARRFGLLVRGALHVEAGKVDRIEQQRRKAGIDGRVGNDAAGEREQDARRLGEQERSEEHTSELQSQSNLVCRLLLEKKKNNK